MKRLLAVSWEMPPMYGPRATQVARTLGALSARGWRSTVVCLAPRPAGPYASHDCALAPPDGVDLVRVASREEWWPIRALWRAVPALRHRPDAAHVWIGAASRAAVRAAADAAGLVTFAQPWSDHLIGLRVQRETGLPWVAHFSDPWADSPYGPSGAAIRARWRRLEADVIRAADALVFVTDATADLVMGKYPAEWRAKVSIVPHGFDPARTPPLPARRRPGPMRLVYTGRFYDRIRTPLPLLAATARLHDAASLEGVLELSFIGPFVEQFRSAAAALGLAAVVRFEPRVTPEEAARRAADADVLLVIDAASREPSVFLSSKLVDYLPLRKPILGLTPPAGASADLLRRLRCPIAPPDDEAAIAAALRGLLDAWRSGTLTIGPDHAAVAAEYDIERTAARLDAVLTRTFSRHRH